MSKVKWSLSQHISNHLGKARLGDVRPPSLWPSEASASLKNDYDEPYVVGACRRSTFFRYTVANYYFYPDTTIYDELASEIITLETPPDRYQKWVWEAGKLYEDFVVEMSKQSGVYVDSQIQIVVPNYNLVGKLDLIVRNPITEKLVAEEIKSVYGHGGNEVLGTPSMRNKNMMGNPRESNLMQIALYDWHLRSRLGDMLESSHLFYGARDTGRDAEYSVTTYLENEVTKIKYQGVAPNITSPVVSKITIDNILSNYNYVRSHFEQQIIPPRDYELVFSEEHIHKLYQRDELTKTDVEQYEKIQARLTENKERISAGKEPKKELKPVIKGDWQCSKCQYARICYDADQKPRLG